MGLGIERYLDLLHTGQGCGKQFDVYPAEITIYCRLDVTE